MHDCDACHAALQRGPRMWHFLLPTTLALPWLLLISHPMFLALLYTYDVIHCTTCLFYLLLCLAHTGCIWLQAFRRANWRGGRFQLLIHTPALYYCVITHCTVYKYWCVRISSLLSLVEVKKFLKLLARNLYRLIWWEIVQLWFQFTVG